MKQILEDTLTSLDHITRLPLDEEYSKTQQTLSKGEEQS